MVNPSVQLHGAERGEGSLEAGDVVERKAEEIQPIDEAVARQNAKRRYLINTGAELPAADRVVEVMRDVTEATIRRAGRFPGHLGQRQSARCKQRLDLTHQNQTRTARGGWHRPASARRNPDF